ncbi:MAG: hypothetical protein U9N50_11755 [Pseudomonadota bacterium]|nr:hypothetical protein [Pseudomonadota bacterium]
MKTSIYAFLTEKWLEEDVDGLKSVFMDSQHQATYDAMVDTLGSDSMYDQRVLQQVYSEIRTGANFELATYRHF